MTTKTKTKTKKAPSKKAPKVVATDAGLLVNILAPEPGALVGGFTQVLKPLSATARSFDAMMKHFPGTPRPQQAEALEEIGASFVNGAQYVMLEAPTGSGKSHIAMTCAKTMGPSYITTLTAQLQEQYHTLFGHLGVEMLKGRGKYHCANARDSCLVGKALFKGDDACQPCAYTSAKMAAFESETMVTNYHSFLWNVVMAPKGMTPQLTPKVRPLMVFDEAHTVENFLLEQMGLEIRLGKYSCKLPSLPRKEDEVQPYMDWLTEALPALKGVMSAITDPHAVEELQQLLMRMHGILQEHEQGVEFIPERGSKRGDDGWELDPTWFALKPLHVASYGKKLWRWGERVLLMSGTILDAGTVATNLGLPLDSGDFIRLDSVFPKENRQIVVRPLPMTKEHRESSWPIVAEYINKLLDHHANEKGLLLCPSNEMLKAIQGHSAISRKNGARFITAFGSNREERYAEHIKSPRPTVLAASGYWEGADLAGDASRFQIIPAVPRAMWNGQIKARARISPTWYRWLNYCKLLQGYGRSVRSIDDSAVTYIFDQEFVSELERASGSLIPDWVREAVKVVR